MNELEQIKKLHDDWKAIIKKEKKLGNNWQLAEATSITFGLEMAIRVFRLPSNQVNAPLCKYCEGQRFHNKNNKYCGQCGRAFDRWLQKIRR